MSEGFEHRLPLNQIRDGERVALIADEPERRRVAERLGLPSLERLEAHATLSRDKDRVRARGRLKAELTQHCVVTGDPLVASADEPFDIMFLPQPDSPGQPEEEVELSQGDCDVVFHDGSSIELGEAIADTLGLSLDPYPRSAGADAALKEAGVLSEAEAGPFAALAQLKRGDSDKP
jgi:uncharacterized metal-binding protein YceD (DUF177 family)